MKKYYVWDLVTKIYAGATECREGTNPSNSTDIKPPKFKTMYEIVWNGDAWAYKPMNEENE